jgi:hypothetical protein
MLEGEDAAAKAMVAPPTRDGTSCRRERSGHTTLLAHSDCNNAFMTALVARARMG